MFFGSKKQPLHSSKKWSSIPSLLFTYTIFLLTFILPASNLLSAAIITFEHSNGRFGDNLISYLHAKWLSHSTGIPLQCNYIDFQFANQLTLFKREADFHQSPHPEKYIRLCNSKFPLNPDESVCYSVPYFPEFESELPIENRLFNVDWKDPLFRKEALEMISPITPPNLTTPPENILSVALHVREGGNHDLDYVRFMFPLKLPPLHFYTDALKQVIALFYNQPIYCQVFTDSINPKKIVQEMEKQLPSGVNIQFHYRTEENHDAVNVLDDFFSFFHYDILIRPESNFSKIPDLLHDFMVVIAPRHAKIITTGNNSFVRVDDVNVNINEQLYDSYLNELFNLN